MAFQESLEIPGKCLDGTGMVASVMTVVVAPVIAARALLHDGP